MMTEDFAESFNRQFQLFQPRLNALAHEWNQKYGRGAVIVTLGGASAECDLSNLKNISYGGPDEDQADSWTSDDLALANLIRGYDPDTEAAVIFHFRDGVTMLMTSKFTPDGPDVTARL